MTLATQAGAVDRICTNNILEFDICEDAKRIADERSQQLPYKMSDRVQVVSFTANKNILSQGVKLLYNRSFFENAIIQQGRSLDDMKMQMFENSRDITCLNETTKAFVEFGGHMRFLYEFSDGEYLFEFYVSVC